MTSFKKKFLRASLAGGSLFIGYVGSAAAIDRTVCPVGCDYTTIQNAVTFVTNSGGGNVIVGTPGRAAPETYYGPVNMRSDVTLISEGDNSTATYTDTLGGTGYSTNTTLKRATLTIIEGNVGDIGPIVMFPDATSEPGPMALDGFTIQQGATPASATETGLVIMLNSSPTVQNCIVRDNTGPDLNGGITMWGDQPAAAPITPQILNNIVHYTHGPGIGIRGNARPTIDGNTVFTTMTSDVNPGVGMRGDAAPIITNNLFFRNGRAGVGSVGDLSAPPTDFGVIENAAGNAIEIRGNVMHSHMPYAGVRISARSTSTDVKVVIGGPNIADSNEFYGNMAGVRLDHQNTVNGRFGDVIIENNDFHNNAVGVRAEYQSNVVIRNNSMNSQISFCAVRAGFSENITIEGNEMHNNTLCGIRIWPDPVSEPILSITNNDISNSGFGGIRIDDNVSGVISGNHIHQNSRGGIVLLSDSPVGTTLEISNNEIDNNVRGGIHTGLEANDGLGFFGTNGGLDLIVRGNKVHHNGQAFLGGGIDVRHAKGVIQNNIVYYNNMGGIRVSDWISEISNNTVVDNGQSGTGGAGIAYDDLAGPVNQNPPGGYLLDTHPISINNNILVGNEKAGINAGSLNNSISCGIDRTHNIYAENNGVNPGQTSPWMYVVRRQTAMCYPENAGELFTDPLFVDRVNHDYRLQAGSPAIDAGDSVDYPNDVSIPPGMGTLTVDMGAYGGQYGITW